MSVEFNVPKIIEQFPILAKKINNKQLVYLDNAATTQKPRCVIASLNNVYENLNANIHRGVHYLSEAVSIEYERARQIVAKFLNAQQPSECIFVRGTTEAVNLVAYGFANKILQATDNIIITQMEHHSNIVPWQVACKKSQAELRVIPMLADGTLDLKQLESLIDANTKLLAITQVSNTLGTINPIKQIIALCKKYNVAVLVDGAQAAPHLKIDVQDLDCDFYAFSGHKVYGPTGIGVLYGKALWLDKLPPYQTGGGMITEVYLDYSTYQQSPAKFEAGTPAFAEAIALGTALEYLTNLNLAAIYEHETMLLNYATEQLQQIPGLQIIGNAKDKISVISFNLSNIHPHDLGTILDEQGIAIRAGHHCTMPIMHYYNIAATARISFGIYNTKNDIDILMGALKYALKLFKR